MKIQSDDNSIKNPSLNQSLFTTSEKETAKQAIGQLSSAIVGHQSLKNSEDLELTLDQRLKRSIENTMAEYAHANSLLHDCAPDARRMVAEAQRKLDSLNSLVVLAKMVDVV